MPELDFACTGAQPDLAAAAHAGDRVEVARPAPSLRIAGSLPRTPSAELFASRERVIVADDERVGAGVERQFGGTGVIGVLDQLQRHDAVALQPLERLLNVPAEVRLVVEGANSFRRLSRVLLEQNVLPPPD